MSGTCLCKALLGCCYEVAIGFWVFEWFSWVFRVVATDLLNGSSQKSSTRKISMMFWFVCMAQVPP